MSQKLFSRCLRCGAPIQFQPGAGSRLCPFCDTVNLVREQRVAAPRKELQTDEVFLLLQKGNPEEALLAAERIISTSRSTPRLGIYRAQALLALGRISEAVYALIDLTGEDAPRPLRADVHALLAEALWTAGRKKEAAESVEKSLHLLAGHPAAVLVKVNLLLEEDRSEAALALTAKAIGDLGKPWKITFPPPSWKFILVLARLQSRTGRAAQAIETLENMLLRLLSAPLPAIAEAFRRLGWAYMNQEPTGTHGLEFIRFSIFLEGTGAAAEQVLVSALEKIGGDLKEQVQQLEGRRSEVMGELCTNLARFGKWPADGLNPNAELKVLGSEPDSRVDKLEQVARLLGIGDFDRGSLYPLQTVEEFYRWIQAGRGRSFLQRFRSDRLDKERLAKLQQVRQQWEPLGDERGADEGSGRSSRRILRWLLISGLVALVLVVFALAILGDRLLNAFSGRLLAIDCGPSRADCWLLIDAGEEGRQRYLRNSEESSAIKRWINSWLDQGLRQDGVIYYSLDFPWGRMDFERYKACLGRSVEKQRFRLGLECEP